MGRRGAVLTACCDLARHASTLIRSLAMISSTDGPGIGVPVKCLGAMVKSLADLSTHTKYTNTQQPFNEPII